MKTLRRLEGFRVLGEGETLGKVMDAYFDDHVWAVRDLVVAGSGRHARLWWLSPHSILRIDQRRRTIETTITAAQWRTTAPDEPDTAIPRATWTGLLKYYGFPYSWRGLDRAVAPRVPSSSGPELHLRSERRFRHYLVHALDGELGHVEDLLVDEHSWAVRYLVVDTRRWRPGGRVLLAPEWVLYVSWLEQSVHTSLEQKTVRTAPPYDRRTRIDRAYEARLRQHYGRPAAWGTHAA
jgi:hypothetical protein